MIYLDTNVLVSAIVGDANAGVTDEWIARQSAPLAVSTWARVEFYSHIGLRMRKNEETRQNALRIIQRFDDTIAESFSLVTSEEAATKLAASWLRDPNCALQTGDALHLAIAVECGATAIATFDQRFARNIERLRLGGLKVIELPAARDRIGRIQQKLADYDVTEKDIAKAVKWARKRKVAEREKAGRLLVRR